MDPLSRDLEYAAASMMRKRERANYIVAVDVSMRIDEVSGRTDRWFLPTSGFALGWDWG